MTVTKGQSVLGRYDEHYSDEEKQLCHRVAMFLKQRNDRGKMPYRDDLDFFVRAAAGLYELAKNLHRLGPLSRKAPPRNTDDWLQILTGEHFSYITDPNLLKGFVDIHVSTEDPTHVTVTLPEPGAKTAKELTDGRNASDEDPILDI